jgi:hypothetical protein
MSFHQFVVDARAWPDHSTSVISILSEEIMRLVVARLAAKFLIFFHISTFVFQPVPETASASALLPVLATQDILP